MTPEKTNVETYMEPAPASAAEVDIPSAQRVLVGRVGRIIRVHEATLDTTPEIVFEVVGDGKSMWFNQNCVENIDGDVRELQDATVWLCPISGYYVELGLV